jgi:hypothetical protein
VTVYDFGEVEGLFYLIMEFVAGTSLRHLLEQRRPTPGEAMRIVSQICDALEYAHARRVVHRDIKPEDILVDDEGLAKVADFGMAKMLEAAPDDDHVTDAGHRLGTPHYRAPEQARGSREVDQRADIFSLGVVLYEMLTGDLPLGHFPRPSRKGSVGIRVDRVVLKALSADPEDRYPSAGEFKEAVDAAAATLPIAPPLIVTPDAAQIALRFRRWSVGILVSWLVYAALARISHKPSTAEADTGMSTALRSVGPLDVVHDYACAGLGRAPCIHARLRLLATKPCEKCGLAAAGGISEMLGPGGERELPRLAVMHAALVGMAVCGERWFRLLPKRFGFPEHPPGWRIYPRASLALLGAITLWLTLLLLGEVLDPVRGYPLTVLVGVAVGPLLLFVVPWWAVRREAGLVTMKYGHPLGLGVALALLLSGYILVSRSAALGLPVQGVGGCLYAAVVTWTFREEHFDSLAKEWRWLASGSRRTGLTCAGPMGVQ